MIERKYFTKEEAKAKVGRRIITRVPWSGVPEGTEGDVTRADESGYTKPPFGEAKKAYNVAIQWDLPREPLQVATGQVEDEPFLAISGGKPLVDWFSKDEYEQYLEELESAK
jgi:hypothetical protein